jgi:iron-sulfur cluster repair protein YtfE (RIC family)
MTVESPLDRLRDDHAAATQAVKLVADLVADLSGSAPTSWPDVGGRLKSGAAELGRILLQHFRLEEEALFPQVRAMMSEGAPAVDILSQFLDGEADDDLTAHFLMRSRLRELTSVLDAGQQAGGLAADQLAAIRTTTNLLTDILRRHADKEHRLIFPMIERMLDAAQMAEVAERMGQIRQAM